jgi:hypothetical protein
MSHGSTTIEIATTLSPLRRTARTDDEDLPATRAANFFHGITSCSFMAAKGTVRDRTAVPPADR